MEYPNIPKGVTIGLDYETSGLKYWLPDFKAHNVAIAVGGQSWAFDFRRDSGLAEWLRDLLPGRRVVAHSAQFEYQVTRLLGIDPRTITWYCTLISQCLIYEHDLTYDLATVCAANNVDSKKSDNLRAMMAAIGVDTPRAALARMGEVPADLAAIYVAGDAADALEVYYRQATLLDSEELHDVHSLEMRLLPVLADMSFVGVKVNLEAAEQAIPALDEQELVLQRDIDSYVGSKFNVNSTPQIRALFKPEKVNAYQYKLIDGTLVGPTKGNKGPSIDQKALQDAVHPIAAKILALRKTIKLRDTFIRGHIIGSADGNGYVHTTFNQTRNDADAGTVTGRLSSVDPALQQITKRDKKNAAILRSLFLPDDGRKWLCADYSQVDFRCGAHLINDPAIIQAYQQDPTLDYHQIVSDMTGIPRNAPYAGAPYAKQINLGLSFGAGAGKICFMMGMPYEVVERNRRMAYIPGTEGKAIFDLYHKKLPGVKKFTDIAGNVAKATGYVKTQIGRRLRFPRRHGAHKAAGLLFQAYAADLHKFGLVRTDELIRREGLPARLMLSVHDEMGISSEQDQEVKRKIVEVYTDFNHENSPIKMRVPITASAKFGDTWWEACKD